MFLLRFFKVHIKLNIYAVLQEKKSIFRKKIYVEKHSSCVLARITGKIPVG